MGAIDAKYWTSPAKHSSFLMHEQRPVEGFMIDIETRPPSAGGRPDWLAASLERGGGQLLDAAVDEADLADALRAQDKLRVVRSDRSRQGRPYAAWKPALETLAEALPSLTEIQQSALQLASIDADAGRLAELPSYQARYRLFDACRALLEEAGRRQPFVVLLPALELDGSALAQASSVPVAVPSRPARHSLVALAARRFRPGGSTSCPEAPRRRADDRRDPL